MLLFTINIYLVMDPFLVIHEVFRSFGLIITFVAGEADLIVLVLLENRVEKNPFFYDYY